MPIRKESEEVLSLEWLRECSLFHAVEDESLARFLEKARLKQYPKHSILFMQDDPTESFYLVVQGWVKLFRETLDGNEAVIDILPAGHLFGETALFEGENYSYSAEAVEDAAVVAIPLSLLGEEVAKNKTLALNMLSSVSHHNRRQSKEIEHLSMQTAPQRLGCFLLRLCPVDVTKEIVLRLPYDKTLVASRLGMKPETFSRSLKKLVEKTHIKVDGATVYIPDITMLSHYACNACSQTFPCEDLCPDHAAAS